MLKKCGEGNCHYNLFSPQISCDILRPNEAHKKGGELKKHWKNYKKKKVEMSAPLWGFLAVGGYDVFIKKLPYIGAE